MTDNWLEPQRLALDMLKECDVWAAKALEAYIHKSSLFDMSRLNLDAVCEHQQKIRIVVKELERSIGSKERMQ
jgi:hypothetical protein